MADSDSIKRRLKEDRIPEAFWPDEWGEKKKRPKEIAVIDVNLCFPCMKCPEFCPVGCIEQLRPGTIPGRGDNQPVQVRVEESIGCYICVEVCANLTDYDAIRMYPTELVEQALDLYIGDTKPDEYHARDTGIGIAEGALPRLLEPFYTTNSSGTGLGLAIAYRIMQDHGGSISILSTPGNGTTVALKFPALAAHFQEIEAAS